MTENKASDQDQLPSDMEKKTIKIQSRTVPGMSLSSLTRDTLESMEDNEDKWIRLAKIIYDNDPAAHSWQEVYDLYPSIKALRAHEQAHYYYNNGDYYLARQLAEESRRETGIEIHPGAQLSDTVFIDHGMGVVIGETAEIGDDVTLYHGVTLGGVSLSEGKRHPTLEDGVVVGAGAKVLGGFTVGKYAKIGSNAVVVKEVPAGATMVGGAARLIHDKAKAEQMGLDSLANNGVTPADDYIEKTVIEKTTDAEQIKSVEQTSINTFATNEDDCNKIKLEQAGVFHQYGIDPNTQDPVAMTFIKMLEHIRQSEARLDELQSAMCKLDPNFCKKHYTKLDVRDLDAVDPQFFMEDEL